MKPFSITLPGGRLIEYSRPVVMGILNVTPDSFFEGSRVTDESAIERRVEEMILAGADMLDIGGYSSRPGAADVPENEELMRLEAGLRTIRRVSRDIPVSVDTFRAIVARRCVEQWGADMVNDISGGKLDRDMFTTIAELKIPYILMHMRGTPADMQNHTCYSNIIGDVMAELAESISSLALLGVNDVIVDPGFGFSKTLDQNYSLLANLGMFKVLGRPLLIGISRKSMITKLLDIHPTEALNGTTVVNTLALERGASILRVHDVGAAREAIDIFIKTQQSILNPDQC